MVRSWKVFGKFFERIVLRRDIIKSEISFDIWIIRLVYIPSIFHILTSSVSHSSGCNFLHLGELSCASV